jgi:hypothetical protein
VRRGKGKKGGLLPLSALISCCESESAFILLAKGVVMSARKCE